MTNEAEQYSSIASFVLDPNLDVPASALAMAAKLLADTIGVAAGATSLDAGRIARDFAVDFHAARDPANTAPLMFDGRRVSIPGAAWAAATQIDNLDGHDGFNPVKGHIGCAVIPALFAFAERFPDLTGQEALTAMVMSYEIAGRAGIALHSTVSDYHTSGAWNALGVAALGCRLNGCNAKTLRQALGIAEYHGPRSQMMREIDNPTMLHDGSGIGALTGSNATLLAKRGFTGAPAITIEDKGVADIWRDLGSVWTIEQNYIKPYPICRWAHAAVDAARGLKLKYEFHADEVQKVEIRTFAEASRLYAGMPETTSQAQYSMAFAVATVLQRGEIAPGHIVGDALLDPATAKLVSRIQVSEEPRHNARFPSGRWSDVTITLRNGRIIESGDINARGASDSPLTNQELRDKFNTMTSGAVSEDLSADIWDACFSLLEANFPFSKLSQLVCQSCR